MSVSYHNLVRQVAYNVGALRGERTPELATSYVIPLTAAELTERGTPLQVLLDAVLRAEEEFVGVIASTGNHPWRAALRSVTNALGDKDFVPAVDGTGKSIVGLYGPVFDETDLTPLQEMPLTMIDRRVRNSNDHYLIPVYWYKFDGQLIRHTRNGVFIEVCSYDRGVQATAIAANSDMLLPDALEHALVERATCLLDANHSPVYADAAVGLIKAGHTSMLPRSVPLPVTQERAG